MSAITDRDWRLESYAYEINRMKAVLRDPDATREEREVAESRLRSLGEAAQRELEGAQK